MVDTGNNRIVRFDSFTAADAGWTTFGSSEGSDAGQFRFPQGVTYAPDGGLYVADTANGRIIKMDDPTGTNWQVFAPSTGPNRIVTPAAIQATARGVWILDVGRVFP